MPVEIAIVGDNFMLPARFEAAIADSCGQSVTMRSMTMPWPDEPMEHGYAKAGMAGLKEYQGDPDEIVEFVADAAVLVTQLAPLSASMMDRMSALRMVAVSRGGPVNIDMEAARARNIRVVNTPGRNASAVAEFAIGAILAETRLIRAGPRGAARRRVAGATCTAPTAPGGSCRK